ncbi:uncharacterized protein Z520_00782 [Fonsecaea multimorphosa CBS 102226]|uniref:Uncharacterized protein n=1 Tax=Fonsecaea multimorphosa CBS 102226 TaxID=1442371 RepID=A0A0D2KKR9_9EURO|nr:uncharacterized protein Z520_00782 [Fonsecaea multimorphosa CBS 102226]KIY04090.1 hypothetical protein Z520_00782 [Fonsecaea multimorphosa CBS 102226]OAL31923.1 hypothetical protein AYO22_00793 [Fonsecaea multimorphosa]
MIDPVSALGAASSVLQFLDFAAKVVTKGNQIYRAGDGVLKEHQDLSLVTSDLLLMKTKLEQLGPDETVPGELLSASSELADRLLRRLNQAQAQGKLRRWKSLRQALKCVCSKKEVDDMANRLAMFRQQIELRLMTSVSTEINQNLVCQTEATDKINEQARTLSSIQNNIGQIKSKVEDVAEVVGREQVVRNEFINASLDNATTTLTKLIDEYGLNLQKTLEYLRTLSPPQSLPANATLPANNPETTKGAILQSFAYQSMNVRPEAVAIAHAETFKWLFLRSEEVQRPWDDFIEWLQFKNDIYWMTGKAASGKSTLFKYILENENTRQLLKVWGGDSEVVIASFFFWSLGNSMQRSQCGLLQSLIYSILQQRPNMISEVLPSLWQQLHHQPLNFFKSLGAAWHVWSVNDLRHILTALINQNESRLKFCLFIDGLDEFDGDHREIADFCYRLCQNSNVKICLSSRPLMVFEEAFGSYSHLRLQDLTRKDIERYVFDNLSNHPRCKISQDLSSQVLSLTEEVVKRASGVFLWVVLVVRSLQAGMTNHDTSSDLQKRLNELPLELDGMYSMMLQNIEPHFYQQQASRLLQLVYHAKGSLSMLGLSFADDTRTEIPSNRDLFATSAAELQDRITTTSARCKSRCAGLLEAVRSSRSREQDGCDQSCPDVNFLHLTVREFLEKPEVWRLLLRRTAETDFDANRALVRASIVMFKLHQSAPAVENAGFGDRCTSMNSHFNDSIFYARQAEASGGRPLLTLMDEIESLGQHSLMTQHSGQKQPFINFLISNGLTLSVKAKYGERLLQIDRASSQSLLESALSDFRDIAGFVPSMIALLLQAGLNPNQRLRRCHVHTVWTSFLNTIVKLASHADWDEKKPELLKPCLDVCELFLLYGANELLHECDTEPTGGVIKVHWHCPCWEESDFGILAESAGNFGKALFQKLLCLLPNDKAKHLEDLRIQAQKTHPHPRMPQQDSVGPRKGRRHDTNSSHFPDASSKASRRVPKQRRRNEQPPYENRRNQRSSYEPRRNQGTHSWHRRASEHNSEWNYPSNRTEGRDRMQRENFGSYEASYRNHQSYLLPQPRHPPYFFHDQGIGVRDNRENHHTGFEEGLTISNTGQVSSSRGGRKRDRSPEFYDGGRSRSKRRWL